jgi:hypothetical protein
MVAWDDDDCVWVLLAEELESLLDEVAVGASVDVLEALPLCSFGHPVVERVAVAANVRGVRVGVDEDAEYWRVRAADAVEERAPLAPVDLELAAGDTVRMTRAPGEGREVDVDDLHLALAREAGGGAIESYQEVLLGEAPRHVVDDGVALAEEWVAAERELEGVEQIAVSVGALQSHERLLASAPAGDCRDPEA